MKKLLVIFLLFGILSATCTVHAEEYQYTETIEIIKKTVKTRAVTTKIAKKTTTYKNPSGSVLWAVTVTGTFTYNGKSASCTESYVSTAVKNTNWKISGSSASKNGNTASATATGNNYINGLLIKSITKTVKLTCSVNGKLS